MVGDKNPEVKSHYEQMFEKGRQTARVSLSSSFTQTNIFLAFCRRQSNARSYDSRCKTILPLSYQSSDERTKICRLCRGYNIMLTLTRKKLSFHEIWNSYKSNMKLEHFHVWNIWHTRELAWFIILFVKPCYRNLKLNNSWAKDKGNQYRDVVWIYDLN